MAPPSGLESRGLDASIPTKQEGSYKNTKQRKDREVLAKS
ncbi:hypothetical protein LEP1GSC120_0926 [Leptospira santarosai str. 200702252]|nr:hypothetical protein LEP1GSC130_1927 [Leptospira santarosai str. 200403458]EMO98111.1 hypothetical protein LEP1GSC120_0926 [Leptospira santarosai str. 200702252]